MAVSYRSRFLNTLATANRQLTALYAELAAGIAADIQRAADDAGNVPRSATFDLQRRANERVIAMFFGRGRAGELAPYDTMANGRVLPLSPYMRVLWDAITAVVALPVAQNGAMLARRLPADVLAVMRQATIDPFAAARAEVAELEVFRPNVLAKYEPPHTWVDPNGYRLSDRIWNTSAHARQQLDLYLETAIREGKGAREMSRELERFLRPDRQNLRTNKPYGTSASYDGMRLARSEITRAHGEAQKAAGAMNPFIAGIKWNLSASHPKPDQCDFNANGGPNGDGVYPLDAVPRYPDHPHDLCYLTNALVGDPDAVIDELVADIRRERQALTNKIGPIQMDAFDRLLLGEELPPRGAVVPIVVRPTAVTPPPAVPAEPTAAQARQRIVELHAEAERAVAAERATYNQIFREELEPLYERQAALLTRYRQATTDAERARIDAEGATLGNRITAIQDRRQVHIDNMLRIERRRDEQIRESVYVRNAAQNTLSWEGRPRKATQEQWTAGMDAFNRLVDRSVWSGNDVPVVRLDAGARAYHQAGKIYITTTEDVGTIVHEIGHAFERGSGVLDRVLAFYDRRTAGDELEQLSALTGNRGYGPTERARRDRWLDPYMGKSYGRRATEIVSMGLEYMHNDPRRLATDDPDYFDFIFDLVRGR